MFKVYFCCANNGFTMNVLAFWIRERFDLILHSLALTLKVNISFGDSLCWLFLTCCPELKSSAAATLVPPLMESALQLLSFDASVCP